MTFVRQDGVMWAIMKRSHCFHLEAYYSLTNTFDPFRVALNLIGEKTSYQETGPKNFPVMENLKKQYFFHRMHFKYYMTMNIIEVLNYAAHPPYSLKTTVIENKSAPSD